MNTAEWNNLSSGLIGAVLGSLLGFLGATATNWLTERGRRNAAGRAVLAEMLMNAGRALSAESTTLQYEFVDHVWRRHLSSVGTLFDWKALRKLVIAYDSGSQLSDLHFNQMQMSSIQQREIKHLLLRHTEEWLDGAEILAPAVLDSSELSELNSETEKLKERIAVSRKVLLIQDSRNEH